MVTGVRLKHTSKYDATDPDIELEGRGHSWFYIWDTGPVMMVSMAYAEELNCVEMLHWRNDYILFVCVVHVHVCAY